MRRLRLRLETLGLVPQLVHFRQSHITERATSFLCLGFYIAKAADELHIGALQSIVWIEVVLARYVDDAEEEVT